MGQPTTPMAAPAAKQSAARYREVVPGPLWVTLLLLAALGVLVHTGLLVGRWLDSEEPDLAWAWIVCLLPLAVGILLVPMVFGRLEILVEDGTLSVRFGYWRLIRRDFPLAGIEQARPVQYRPLREFGGWGIRRGRLGGRVTLAYTVRGSKGVLLTLSRPARTLFGRSEHVLIGSLQPERLTARLGLTRARPGDPPRSD